MSETGIKYVGPAIKFFISPIVAILEFVWCEAGGLKNNCSCIVQIPVACQDTTLRFHILKQPGAGVWRKNVICGCSNGIFDAPVNGSFEYVFVIIVESEDKASI